MPTTATLERFIARVESNAHAEAIEEFYTENASMQENNAAPRVGRDVLVAGERKVLARAASVTSTCMRPVFVNGDHVVIRWVFEFEWLDGRSGRTWYSPRWREIFGLTADEPGPQTRQEYLACVHPDDRDRLGSLRVPCLEPAFERLDDRGCLAQRGLAVCLTRVGHTSSSNFAAINLSASSSEPSNQGRSATSAVTGGVTTLRSATSPSSAKSLAVSAAMFG